MDQKWMKLAIEMAKSTMGQTSPNPAVGAVVVKDGRVIGMGAHLRAGEGHAEVNALKQADDEARGATIYVTLEPCSHFGKTPPCAELVIEKGIKRVVIGSADPNPIVAGKGIARLKQAGINVVVGVCEEEARSLNEFYFYHVATQTPFVTLKAAMTLDGKIATETGDSKWVTSPEAREDVHLDRHLHDAILVGANTVKADNPSLTTRLPNGGVSPIRIVLDTALSIGDHSTILTDGCARTWVICGKSASKEREQLITRHNQVWIIRMAEEKILLPELLKRLGEEKIHSIYVEGGAKVHGAFLDQKLVNRLVMYIAPKIVGNGRAFSVFNGAGVLKMDDAWKLSIESMHTIGPDIKVTALLQERR
ncbi:bifunctional diaminohydroxyphosphoribosylaminopyrimidine deaminase/5-amino-6-(5-phosphoribosylamino)uracil reductase RibD [Jeotgalibacillus marinus]|uniref:Riboflavin biosynthesis protein RibD n=1 Tax=Jeotgalibacillus marinus TaxID=86667 RepID=A0ABV3Q3V3_9BACL